MFHGFQGDLGRLAIGGLHGVHSGGLLLFGRLRHAHRDHHGRVSPRVLVDQGLESSLDDRSPRFNLGKFRFHAFVSGLAASETRDHAAQGRGQGSGESRHTTATWSRSWSRDRGEELFDRRILHSHNWVSRICSR